MEVRRVAGMMKGVGVGGPVGGRGSGGSNYASILFS